VKRHWNDLSYALKFSHNLFITVLLAIILNNLIYYVGDAGPEPLITAAAVSLPPENIPSPLMMSAAIISLGILASLMLAAKKLRAQETPRRRLSEL
jgi:hypothetical protein